MARANIGASGPEVFSVCRHLGGWAVRHDGAYSHLSASKEEAMTSANRQARATTTPGRPSRVTVSDEPGFFDVPRAGPSALVRHGVD